MISLDDQFVLRSEILVQEIGGDRVVVDPIRAEFFVLNASASYLLDRMQSAPATLRQLAADLGDHFDLSPTQAQADILAWAAELINANAISQITAAP